MAQELSGVTIVIIIGGGVLTFILLFIFAKRQITRFALRSARGPHLPIGHKANKALKREIDRRIEVIPKIVHEPQLISEEASKYILDPGKKLPSHYFRLKAVDDIKLLEREIARSSGGMSRQPCDSLRAFLLSVLASPLGGRDQRAIHRLCDVYEHARHDPADFGDEEYQAFNRLFLKAMDAARQLKPFSGHKSSPSRTPARKRASMRPTLDPSRLRPPNATAIANVHSSYTNMRNIDDSFDDEIVRADSKSPIPMIVHPPKADGETTV